MEIKDLQGKLVAVLGYGIEGQAVTKYLLKHGIKPTIFDQRLWSEWEITQREEIKKLEVNFIFGPDCFKELAGFNIAFRSPGIKLEDLKIGNLEITSQTKWFFKHCPAKIIGVTGTKGKGTTSTLIYEMLSLSSRNVPSQATYLTGNIGKVQPLEILEKLSVDDWVVYELSSFQLQDLKQSPQIGVVLMVTSEHLDYHKNTEEYREAKSAIVKFQKPDDVAVVNVDFPASLKIGNAGQGKKLYFSRQLTTAECFVESGNIISPIYNFQFPISQLQLRGAHNLENICAAVLAAKAAGASNEAITEISKTFRGLEHRLEFVAEKHGIKFYNDSFSTTPETAIAAIKSFNEPEILILGGSRKNSDFTELAGTIAQAKNIRAVILIGQEAPRLKQALENKGVTSNVISPSVENMSDIFEEVRKVSLPGDAVLLSPACASFGMFKNYKDRGEQFKKQVSLY